MLLKSVKLSALQKRNFSKVNEQKYFIRELQNLRSLRQGKFTNLTEHAYIVDFLWHSANMRKQIFEISKALLHFVFHIARFIRMSLCTIMDSTTSRKTCGLHGCSVQSYWNKTDCAQITKLEPNKLISKLLHYHYAQLTYTTRDDQIKWSRIDCRSMIPSSYWPMTT